ncbi:MAG TPA: TetR/AcrR family transcriptional regulator [Chitinophaga sp.]|uniref:TetR/AcrR family transcriptional regulator n=1 Tax=Chitinophaga sp. TaxID=1869181 RepID=UPI002C42899A|nr:TetR/AcrR family transcriptional regulator [Chitinophaga sp.]HVI49568.1 TetR/AcrR family transcriptional regulator [Chitinophaga sp.]
MSGRSRIFDEQDVISKATSVFWEKGYEATSTDDLQLAMGIGKGSFYNAFPGGKREIFGKAIDQFNQRGLQSLRTQLAQSNKPVDVIRQFFRNIAKESKPVHMKGCFMGNTIAELSSIDHALEHKAVKSLQQLEALFQEVIREAQQKGDLSNDTPAPLLARHLVNLWSGLGITRRMYPNAAGLTGLIELNLKILQ